MLRLALLFLIDAAPLVAQTPAVRTVRGEVRDTAGQPLDQVQVIALGAGRSVRTGPDGEFRLDSIALGKERFLFRGLGYNRVEATFVVVDDDSKILVQLTPLALTLDPVVVRRRRTGLFGIVGDVLYQPVPDVDVQVLGAGEGRVHTDSFGLFSMPSLPAGNFVLLLRRRGYYPVRRSLTLPAGEYREVSILLVPLPAGVAGRRLDHLSGFGGLASAAWDMHALRRVRCADGNSVLVPREELAGEGRASLDVALARVASVVSRGFGPSELRDYVVFVDGWSAGRWPLSAIRAEDVETVEIYRSARARPLPSISSFGNAAAPQLVRSPWECPRGTVWVWLRS